MEFNAIKTGLSCFVTRVCIRARGAYTYAHNATHCHARIESKRSRHPDFTAYLFAGRGRRQREDAISLPTLRNVIGLPRLCSCAQLMKLMQSHGRRTVLDRLIFKIFFFIYFFQLLFCRSFSKARLFEATPTERKCYSGQTG